MPAFFTLPSERSEWLFLRFLSFLPALRPQTPQNIPGRSFCALLLYIPPLRRPPEINKYNNLVSSINLPRLRPPGPLSMSLTPSQPFFRLPVLIVLYERVYLRLRGAARHKLVGQESFRHQLSLLASGGKSSHTCDVGVVA